MHEDFGVEPSRKTSISCTPQYSRWSLLNIMIEHSTFEFSTGTRKCEKVHVGRMFDPLTKDLSRKSYNAIRN